MYDERNIPKAMFRFACILVALTFLFGMLNIIHGDNEGIKNMSSGYITDKEIIYQRATYFRDSTTEYILYFEGEYTNSFHKETTHTKKVYVDEETYKYYNVGDYFDSKKLIEAEMEE